MYNKQPMQNIPRSPLTSFPSAAKTIHPSLPATITSNNTLTLFDGIHYPPPFTTTQFSDVEEMNSSPHFIRSSMYIIPCTSTLYNAINMPLYIAMQPFYSGIKNIVDRVVVCNECLSYVNVYTQYENDGMFVCNICMAKNKIDDYRYDSLATFEYEVMKNQIDTKMRNETHIVGDDYFSWRLFTFPVLIVGIQLNEYFHERVESVLSLLSDDRFEGMFGKVCVFVFGESMVAYKNIDFVEEYVMYDVMPFLSPDFFCDRNKTIEIINYLKEKNDIEKHKITLNMHVLNFVLYASRYSFGKALLFVDEQLNVPDNFQSKIMDNSFGLNIVTTYESAFDEIFKSGCGSILKGSLLPMLSPTYYDVYLEVKTSDSLTKSAILTHVPIENTLLIHYPFMDASTVVGCSFTIDESTKEGQNVYIQVIVRYSDYTSRRLMVFNHGFITSNIISNIFSGFTFDTIFHYFARTIAEDASKHTILKNSIVKNFKLYRHLAAKTVGDLQMVLPETLKLLPLLYSSLLKQLKMLPHAQNLSIVRTLRLFYPRIFSLTDYILTSKITLINASFGFLSYSDTYVIDNGIQIYIYIGREISVTKEEFLEEEKDAIWSVRKTIMNEYNEWMEVCVVKMGEKDVEVLGMMVEDKMCDVSSYGDFLCELHYMIKE